MVAEGAPPRHVKIQREEKGDAFLTASPWPRCACDSYHICEVASCTKFGAKSAARLEAASPRAVSGSGPVKLEWLRCCQSAGNDRCVAGLMCIRTSHNWLISWAQQPSQALHRMRMHRTQNTALRTPYSAWDFLSFRSSAGLNRAERG